MSRYGTLYHDAKQSLCPPNTSSCLFFEQQIFSKWGKLRGSAMALSQGIWTDGLVSQLTPDRLLSRQHSHECHAWLIYYKGFRNETHLFYLGNLSGWSQREQFESFFSWLWELLPKPGKTKILLPCAAALLAALALCSSAGAARGGSVALWFALFLVLIPFSCWHTGVVSPEGASGVSYKIVHRCKVQKSVSWHAGFN